MLEFGPEITPHYATMVYETSTKGLVLHMIGHWSHTSHLNGTKYMILVNEAGTIKHV